MSAPHERCARCASCLPVVMLALVVAVPGTCVVRVFAIPPYVLPSPGLVLRNADRRWAAAVAIAAGDADASRSQGFLLAALGGIGLAVLFNQWRLVEYSLYPYAVILQVTPVVAIAPLLLIYLPQPVAVLACAWIVAFFPVLANTTLGLNSVDHNLVALFQLYKASRWQVLLRPEAAGGAAADARRPAHRRRPVADRRGGGGNRRGLGRRRIGACLPHCRIRLPAQHPAHVRGAAAAVARRRRDLLRAVGAVASRCCAAGTRAR